MIRFLFLDLDDTILDFHKAERIAIQKTIGQFGVTPTEKILNRYHAINKWHWEQLELGKLTRAQVLQGRFGMLFSELGVEADAAACAKAYEKNLSVGHYFLPGAEEAVALLSQSYRLFLVSNGTSTVQHSRLQSANLYRFFEKVFISQEIGYNKPSSAFFQACFSQIPDFDPKQAMIVGDSLSSDILGGINAGIATCWISSTPYAGSITPDYTLESLRNLPALLGKINSPEP